jgi:hypothetical protein
MDNKNLEIKINLRKEYLTKDKNYKVLNCCAGDNKIWNEISKEYKVETTNIDLKKNDNSFTADSSKLSESISSYDIIDIDTYGSPSTHISNFLSKFKTGQIIYLTNGTTSKNLGILKKDDKILLGIDTNIKVYGSEYLQELILLSNMRRIKSCRIKIIKIPGVTYAAGIKDE